MGKWLVNGRFSIAMFDAHRVLYQIIQILDVHHNSITLVRRHAQFV